MAGATRLDHESMKVYLTRTIMPYHDHPTYKSFSCFHGVQMYALVHGSKLESHAYILWSCSQSAFEMVTVIALGGLLPTVDF